MEQSEIRKQLKKKLKKSRYDHSKGVMYTAGCLAMAYGYSMEDAMLAGLLHDCAKYLTDEEAIRLCKKNDIHIHSVEYESPYLLHAKLGAFFAETEYGITDPAVLNAIKVHTTGKPDMGMLDKIVYAADYIEPLRNQASNLTWIRELAFQDLDACVAEILHDTILYLARRAGQTDPMTQITYDFYRQYRKEEQGFIRK